MEANVQNAQAVYIPLSEATLSQVKAGMIWYEDDTVSAELIPGKSVKSVVLIVQNGVVYGDLFVEEQKSKKEISDFVKSYHNEFVTKGSACQLTNREMALLLPDINKINATLVLLEKPTWDGAYLTETESCNYYCWVYHMPSGVRNNSCQTSGKVRLVIRYSV